MTISNSRILVVDDHFGIRDNLETFLQGEGYITDSADSAAHALMLIAERLPDLIVLDVSMPGMDGYEVARRLKSSAGTADIPIIMMSAHTSRSARLVGLSAGVEAFLTKPIDPTELGLNVRNLLQLRQSAQAAA